MTAGLARTADGRFPKGKNATGAGRSERGSGRLTMRSTGFRGKAGRRKRRGVTTRTHRDQINHGNVHELDLRWKRSVDAASPDAPPVVHQGVLYLLTPDDRLHGA